MITGRASGSGKYSYQETSAGSVSVQVSHMPEDGHRIRVTFKQGGETLVPIMRMSLVEAELLWASFKRMAIDLGWDDRLMSEILEEKKK